MIYNISRPRLELVGNSNAAVLDETFATKRVRVLGEFDLHIMKDDISLGPHLEREGFWEAWVTSWLTHWLRPGMTFLDIGANVGYYTMLAEKIVGRYGTVVAYECNPDYAELLRATRAINNASFKIREVAVSDHVGKALLTVPENYHGSGSIASQFKDFEITRVYEVSTTTLDLEARNLVFYRHDFIKIDAEGAEEKILDGAGAILGAMDHTTIMLEYTPGAYSDTFLTELYRWGDVKVITGDAEEKAVSGEWIKSQEDWVMLVVRKR